MSTAPVTANPLDRLPVLPDGVTPDLEKVGLFEILNASGDTKRTWDRESASDVGDARRSFDYLRGQGFALFRVNRQGAQGQPLEEFDPEAGGFIAVPQIQGG